MILIGTCVSITLFYFGNQKVVIKQIFIRPLDFYFIFIIPEDFHRTFVIQSGKVKSPKLKVQVMQGSVSAVHPMPGKLQTNGQSSTAFQ